MVPSRCERSSSRLAWWFSILALSSCSESARQGTDESQLSALSIEQNERQRTTRRTGQLLGPSDEVVEVLLVQVAALAQRVDLADDVLVLARLVEKRLVDGDELGDALLELVVRRLLDGDLGRHLLEVVAQLRTRRAQSVRGAREAAERRKAGAPCRHGRGPS